MKPIVIRGKPAKYPLICAPMVGATRAAVLAEAQAALASRADIVEWRVDHFAGIADTGKVIDTGRALRAALGELPMLFTRRSAAEGGKAVPITEKQAAGLYFEVCAAGFAQLADFEMSSAAENLKAVREATRRHGVGLVCSYHDFEKTESKARLLEHFLRAAELGGDVAKVSVMAREPGDALTLLDATLEASRSTSLPLIGISMGPHGAPSRILGFAYGSALTFGVAGAASAPGQMPIGELRAAIEIAQRSLGG